MKTKKKMCSILVVFWLLVVSFIGVTITVITPLFGEYMGFPFLATSGSIFIILGIALIYLTIKRKLKGWLKKFLILTGASPACFVIFSILHNVFYALGILTGNIVILKYLMEALHVLFFLIAVFVCPLGFLVGVVGSIVIFIRKSRFSAKSDK